MRCSFESCEFEAMAMTNNPPRWLAAPFYACQAHYDGLMRSIGARVGSGTTIRALPAMNYETTESIIGKMRALDR